MIVDRPLFAALVTNETESLDFDIEIPKERYIYISRKITANYVGAKINIII